MSEKLHNVLALVFMALFVVSSMIHVTKAATAVVLTPTSGEPGDTLDVACTGFAVSTSAGIGFGPETVVVNEPVTLTATGINTATGFTANAPIKPGSFRWLAPMGTSPIEIFDNGDGTLDDTAGFLASGVINYTTGFFSRNVQMGINLNLEGNTVNYTTYAFGVTPAGLASDGSGALTAQITVPQIWNGSETVWVVDEKGNVGSANYTVTGSTVIPEPLTLAGVVVLSSVALIVSVYFLRKKPAPKITP